MNLLLDGLEDDVLDADAADRGAEPAPTPPVVTPPKPPASSSASKPKGGPAYPPAASIPTQEGPHGIRYDFNLGARILLPAGATWHVRLTDLDTGNILFENENQGAMVSSAKRYYVRFKLEVWKRNGVPCFEHSHDCAGQDVLIQFPVGTLGDVLAWFPYADRFARERGCRVTCAMSEPDRPAAGGRPTPHIRFVSHETCVAQELDGSRLRHL